MSAPVAKKCEAISDRMAKQAAAFKAGQLRDHPIVTTFAVADAGGQRGWGPMMQT
jgi:hypothetical protein